MSARPHRSAWSKLDEPTAKAMKKHVASLGERRAAEVLGIGAHTLRELASAGGTARPDTIARVRDKLRELAAKAIS